MMVAVALPVEAVAEVRAVVVVVDVVVVEETKQTLIDQTTSLLNKD